MQRGRRCAFLFWLLWHGLSTCLWSCLLSALRVLRVLRGVHFRFCYCLHASAIDTLGSYHKRPIVLHSPSLPTK